MERFRICFPCAVNRLLKRKVLSVYTVTATERGAELLCATVGVLVLSRCTALHLCCVVVRSSSLRKTQLLVAISRMESGLLAPAIVQGLKNCNVFILRFGRMSCGLD